MYKLRAPYINDYKIHPKVKYRVNLPLQMAECELNYTRCNKLLANSTTDRFQFAVTRGQQQTVYGVSVIERSPYATTLQFMQIIDSSVQGQWLKMPKLTVRLYHDAKLAEVLAWEGHKRLRPRYDYPNQSMYQSDEKLQVNQFLGEWLTCCLEYGHRIDRLDNFINFYR